MSAYLFHGDQCLPSCSMVDQCLPTCSMVDQRPSMCSMVDQRLPTCSDLPLADLCMPTRSEAVACLRTWSSFSCICWQRSSACFAHSCSLLTSCSRCVTRDVSVCFSRRDSASACFTASSFSLTTSNSRTNAYAPTCLYMCRQQYNLDDPYDPAANMSTTFRTPAADVPTTSSYSSC